jgi:hypothetical protein
MDANQRRGAPDRRTAAPDHADADARKVVGDDLEPHELWQHANLRARGLAGTQRGGTEASKNNPVVILDAQTHRAVSAAQRSTIRPSLQTPSENIAANAQLLKSMRVMHTGDIERLRRLAVAHAQNLGHFQ